MFNKINILFFSLLLSALTSFAVQGTSGSTATQHVLTYTAGNNNQCSIEVSPLNTYNPLVHAVDGALFVNANKDGQTNIGSRAIIIGQKWIAQENVDALTSTGITVGVASARRASISKVVVVTYTNQPFIVGDNIVVTGMANGAYNDVWSRVVMASTNSFSYEVVTASLLGGDTSGGGTVKRADRYSLALAANTQYFVRIGQTSNCGATSSSLTGSSCSGGVCTGNFATTNIPNGNQWAEVSVVDNNSVQMQPTIFDERTTTYNDPLTGVVVKRITLYSDSNIAAVSSGSKFRDCSLPLSNGGVHCWIGMGQSANSRLYWICRTSPTCSNGAAVNTVRFLGSMASSFTDSASNTWISNIGASQTNNDASNANRFYVIAPTNNQHIAWKSVLGYIDYNGGDVSAANNANWSTATSSRPPGNITPITADPSGTLNDIQDACVAGTGVYAPPGSVCFNDANFLSAKFAGCGQIQVEGNLIQYQCLSKSQDSMGWLFVYNLTTNKLVAGAPTYANPTCRWCGEHGTFDTGSANWYGDSPKTETNATGNSLYTVKLTGAVLSTDTAFTVTGGLDGTIGEPQNFYPATRSDNSSTWNFLQLAKGGAGGRWGGDIFWFQDGTGEQVRILTKTADCSGTATCAWTSIQRGVYGTTAQAHAANAVLAAYCEEQDRFLGPLLWNYALDPTRSDTTNATAFIHAPDNSASHGWNKSPNFAFDAGIWDNGSYGTDYVIGNASTVSSLLGPTKFTVGLTQKFSGIATDSPTGAAFQNYENWDAENASFKDFSLISFYFVGSNYGGFFTNITGHIYKMTRPFPDVTPNLILPYESFMGINRMVDISGPSSLLPNTSSNQFCFVKVSGECWSGSNVGDMYADFTPDPGVTHCTIGGEGVPYKGNDWCVMNASMLGARVVQEGLVVGNSIGTGTFYGFPNITISDFAKSRALLTTMYGPTRQQSGYIHTVPDGNAIDFNSCIADPHLSTTGAGDQNVFGCHQYLALVPPQPSPDGIDRTTYGTAVVAIGSGSGGATHARIKYGYEENEPVRGTTWPPTINFYCTQYQGICYSESQNITLNSTYNLNAGVPQRVMFYQVEYLDGSNSVVYTDPLTVTANFVSNLPPSAPQPPTNVKATVQ